MSITDELREWAKDNTLQDRVLTTYPPQHVVHGVLETLLRIADRIDAEHESACAAAYGNGVMSVPIALDESAWVELPKDADGVPIRIGDVMAYADNTKPMEVVALVPPDVFLTEDGPRYADMCRHYHKPTVEDVLREFAEKITDSQIPGMHPTYEEAIAEYAKRLTLAEGEDA